MLQLILLFSFLFSTPAHSLSEQQFHSVIDKVESIYQPIAKQRGVRLNIIRQWQDNSEIAYTDQINGEWIVALYGGYARRSEITEDGFALTVCHELGHHFAGYPFYSSRDWAASEGQADYYATQICAKKIWSDDTIENARWRFLVDEAAKKKCDLVYEDQSSQNICYRSAMAGKSFVALSAALLIPTVATPSFDTNDTSIVDRTIFTFYPSPQCRLDTFLAGALCQKKFPDALIPALAHPKGQDSIFAEKIGSTYSCTEAGLDAYGLRPKCFFAPTIASPVTTKDIITKEISGDGDSIWEPSEVYGINLYINNYLLNDIETASLTIHSHTTQYPTIKAESKAIALQYIPIKLDPNLRCGDKFNIIATIQSGSWQKDMDMEFTLGGYISVLKKKVRDIQEIPDGDLDGITSKIRISNLPHAERVVINIEILHPNLKDLKYFLISPKGIQYQITKNNLGTFVVELKSDDQLNGDWSLKVIDTEQMDSGYLQAWELDFSEHHCVD